MLESVVISGIAFGLAGALHCAAMCGGIACGALLLLGAPTSGERYRQLALMQAGRVTTYATMGAVGGAARRSSRLPAAKTAGNVPSPKPVMNRNP